MVITYGDKIRTKLDKKIFQSTTFDPKTVTIIKKSSPVYNDRDEIESYTNAETETDAVPYDLVTGRKNVTGWATLKEGDGSIAMRYSVDIDVGDIVVIDSVNYDVITLDPNLLPESVVKIVTLSKQM